MKDTFVFYKSWRDAIVELPSDIRLEVYESVIRYACGETVEGLKPLAQVAFSFIKQDIDRTHDNYQTKIVDRNRENGPKGGRPKKTHENPNNPVGFSETQKTLNENDNVNENVDDGDSIPPIIPPQGVTWRDSFEVYKSELREAYKNLRQDKAWISERKRLNPRVDVLLTLEKVCIEFWATEAGWQHKKSKQTASIDWKQIFTKAISDPKNKVYEPRTAQKTTPAAPAVVDCSTAL